MADTDDLSETTRHVLAELEPGTVVDDRVILSTQQVAAIVGGGATLAGVLGLAVGSGSAQSGGVLGSDSEPIDATLANYGSTSTASGYEFTIEGDTYQVNE